MDNFYLKHIIKEEAEVEVIHVPISKIGTEAVNSLCKLAKEGGNCLLVSDYMDNISIITHKGAMSTLIKNEIGYLLAGKEIAYG